MPVGRIGIGVSADALKVKGSVERAGIDSRVTLYALPGLPDLPGDFAIAEGKSRGRCWHGTSMQGI